jgi:hypothetical protein
VAAGHLSGAVNLERYGQSIQSLYLFRTVGSSICLGLGLAALYHHASPDREGSLISVRCGLNPKRSLEHGKKTWKLRLLIL